MARSFCRPLILAAAAGLAISSATMAQPAPDPSREVLTPFDTGVIPNIPNVNAAGMEPVQIWAQDITVPRSSWLRVHFGPETRLSGASRHRGGAYLVITSVEDGAQHFLDATTLPEWDNISAFMNGESVLIQLFAVPGAGENRVAIEKVTAGTGRPFGERTICGATDDRDPYNEPRAGRLSTGCTAWLISENGASNEFLTAGHCINNNQAGVVVSFNPPASLSNGNSVAPPPEFQFPVQAASIQSLNNAAVGDEYARFNTNNNSNTGLSARVAQGRGAYILASAAPAGGAAATTVRGFGVVNDQGGIPAVPWQWNVINKTHVAPYAGKVGTRINYLTDTDGGNSGSPVTQVINFLEQAIGIHTDGFCPGTFNSGTAIEHPGLQAALASPQGTFLPYDSTVSKGLTTTLASNNGGFDGGTIFFDVQTGPRSLEVTSFLLNIHHNGTTNNATASEDDDFFNFDVYVRPGTALGAETSSVGWTLVAEGAGMPKPQDQYTLGALRNTFTLNGGQSYGVAIVMDAGAGHAYTEANGSNETYDNADLMIRGISASNTPFGTNFAGRVFNGGINYDLNAASGQCLETIYATDNSASNGGMVFFNVVVGSQPVTLSGISTNVDGAGGLACDLTIYRKTGTHVGFETNAGAWTQVATAEGTSEPVDTPSSFQLSNFVTLNANTTYGFGIRIQTSGGAADGHAYTDGTGLNQSYDDGRITINTGSAINGLFTGTVNTPRVWNGSFCYGRALTSCSNSIALQSPPDAEIGGFISVPGGQEEADSFGSAQNMSVNSVTVWGSYTTLPPANQDFVVRFFSNAGGLPGTLLATRTVNNVALQDTGLWSTFGRPIYQYNINFANVGLPFGLYWISVLGDEPGATWTWNRTDTLTGAHAVRNGAGPWALSSGNFAMSVCGSQTPLACYANCDSSTAVPILNVADFTCFLQRYAAGEPYANCDNSTTPPVLNVADFTCYLQRYAAGCP
jgi:hypothetical protein